MVKTLIKRDRKNSAIPDLELLDLLSRGWTKKEIAEDYGIRHETMQVTIYRLVERMECKTLCEAIYKYATKPKFDVRGFWMEEIG